MPHPHSKEAGVSTSRMNTWVGSDGNGSYVEGYTPLNPICYNQALHKTMFVAGCKGESWAPSVPAKSHTETSESRQMCNGTPLLSKTTAFNELSGRTTVNIDSQAAHRAIFVRLQHSVVCPQ